MNALGVLARFVGKTFAVWVLVFTVAAYLAPDVFKPLAGYIIWLLGMVMFGMGLTSLLEISSRSAVGRARWDWG